MTLVKKRPKTVCPLKLVRAHLCTRPGAPSTSPSGCLRPLGYNRVKPGGGSSPATPWPLRQKDRPWPDPPQSRTVACSGQESATVTLGHRPLRSSRPPPKILDAFFGAAKNKAHFCGRVWSGAKILKIFAPKSRPKTHPKKWTKRQNDTAN